MLSFGEKLRRERESRNTALEEIARTTKIQSCFLEALERNQFDALPGRSFGKLYIRAYADVLGFDPRPLIADYDREHQNQARRALEEEAAAAEREAAAEAPGEEVTEEPEEERVESPLEGAVEALPEEPAEISVEEAAEEPREEPVEVPLEEAEQPPAEETIGAPTGEPAGSTSQEPSETSKAWVVESPGDRPVAVPPKGDVGTRRDEAEAVGTGPETGQIGRRRSASEGRRTVIVAPLVIVGLLALTLWVYLAFFRTGTARSEPAADAVPSQVEANEEAAEPPGRDQPPAAVIATTPPPEPEAARPTGTARLSVPEFGVGRRVVNHRLQGRGERFEEGTVVWFWTRVLGGGPGESIRHVWLHEGRPVESTELKLGGPHWRTHSRKTLRGVGQWAVEARDSQSRVLARTTFTCAPPGS